MPQPITIAISKREFAEKFAYATNIRMDKNRGVLKNGIQR